MFVSKGIYTYLKIKKKKKKVEYIYKILKYKFILNDKI